MHYFHSNLRRLRKYKSLTQEALAEMAGITRAKVAAYERNSQPDLEVLLRLSSVLGVAVDSLLKEDLDTWSDLLLQQRIEHSTDYVSGQKLRILSTTVNSNNEELAEMVPFKARAGYLQAYADPQFISELPRISLPMMSKNKKYRAFQVQGDSMPPIQHNDWVVCSYEENWLMLKSGEKYVMVTQNEGLMLKTAYNQLQQDGGILLVSSNPAYKPFLVPAEEIQEVWKVEWWFTQTLD